MAVTTRSRFWGPLFPDVWDVAGRTFWGPLFPDPGPELDTVVGIGPAGAATFVLDLDGPLEVGMQWQTDVFKAYNGQEKRAAVLDQPQRTFKGSALLIGGASVRGVRNTLETAAAAGQPFLLGLPFEAILLTADTPGTTLTIGAGELANCDWANPGQRVVVVGRDRTAVDAVVQSASGTSIVLDVAPGATGRAGGYVMPTVPIYLDPQQAFARYRNAEGFERWAITGSAASFGYQTTPVAAILRLEEPVTEGGALTGVVLQARTAGIAGNDIRVFCTGDSLSGVDVSEVGTDVFIKFVPDDSTAADFVAAVNASSTLVKAIGSWPPTQTLAADPSGDEFSGQLDGGYDGAYATDGQGATVATHDGRPVFDRGIVVDDTAGDSLQAMNEILALGGQLANRGSADVPDWGRFVAMRAKWGLEWQWLKKFLATVRGRQRAFWLPTMRNDLTAISSGANTLTIESGVDFSNWYPSVRSAIQVKQADGTITRATIGAAVDNGDGTTTLTIGTTLSGSAIEMVSWLELCRFEDDRIPVTFTGAIFTMQTTARVVTR